jgi:hypothetical protein
VINRIIAPAKEGKEFRGGGTGTVSLSALQGAAGRSKPQEDTQTILDLLHGVLRYSTTLPPEPFLGHRTYVLTLNEAVRHQTSFRRSYLDMPAYSSFGACDGDGDDEFGRAAIEKIHGQDEGGPGTGLLTSDGGIEIPYISPRWL